MHNPPVRLFRLNRLPGRAVAATVHRGLALAACLLLAGCAALRPGFETPTVTISGLRVVPSNNPIPTFEIGLRVVNPNPDRLKLRGVAYSVTLEGREIVTGAGTDLPAIPAYGEGQFTVTAQASVAESFRLLTDLMARPQDRLAYEVTTKLDIGGIVPPIRVTDRGELRLQ